MNSADGPLEPVKAVDPGGLAGPDVQDPGEPGELGLPRLPGFREMALRRMAGERRRLVSELTAQRQAAALSQTQVAARMGTSQSAVARLEAGEADVRASTLERYAAAIGSQISWRLLDTPPAAQHQPYGQRQEDTDGRSRS
jgi:predicted XRE-type DNA-binding protein